MKKEVWFKIGRFFLAASLLLAAGFLRFYRLNWDEGHFFHPDERNIAAAVSRIRFFDRLDPEFFAYGGLPIYLYRAAGEVLNWLTKEKGWTYDWEKINLIGRGFSALFSTLTVGAVYFLAKEVSKKEKAGWLAAFLTAFTASLIQTAHYGVTESMITFWAVVAVWGSVRLMEERELRKMWWLMMLWGLAVATKVSMVSLGAVITLVGWWLFWREQRKRGRKIVEIGVLVGIAAVTFFLFSPYTLLSWKKFWESMRYEGGIVSGRLKVVYVLQFLKTLPYWFQIRNLWWQMGPALAIASVAGLVWGGVRFFKERGVEWLVFMAWPLSYFLLVGGWYAKFVRYMVPLLPFLNVLAAEWLVRWEQKRQVIGKVLMGLVMVGSVIWSLAWMNIYRQESTRITASRWIYSHVPTGARILGEHWDDGLPVPLGEWSPARKGYKIEALRIYDADTEAKRDYLAAELAGADFLVINSRRLYGTLINLKEQYPLVSRYYRLLFEGKLGYRKVAKFKVYPAVWGVEFPTAAAEETIQVYDHPKVMVFENVGRWGKEELRKRLGKVEKTREVHFPNSANLLGKIGVVGVMGWCLWWLLPERRRVKLKEWWREGKDEGRVKKKAPLTKGEVGWFILILLLGIFLRTYRIARIPPGLHGDEAQSGLEAREILAGRPYYPYSAEVYGQTTAYFYLVAFLFRLFGESATTIRLASVLLGIVSLPALFYLTYRLSSARVALWASFFLAVSRWHLQLSRVGLMVVTAPLFTLLSVGFFYLGLKEKRERDFVWAGVFTGLGLNAYMSLRLIPVLLLLMGVSWFLKKKKQRGWVLKGMIIWGVTAFLVSLPLLNYAVHNWDIFMGRSRSIWLFGKLPFKIAVVEWFKNLKRSLLMFHLKGRYLGHRNLPGAPMFDRISGILLIIGFLVGWQKLGRSLQATLLFTFLAFIVASCFSIDGGGDPFRTSGLLPIAVIWAGVGMEWIVRRFKGNWWILLLIAVVGLNFYSYFKVFPNHPEIWRDFHCVPVEVARYSNSLKRPHKIYLLSNWFYIDYLSIRFLAPNLEGENFFKQLGQYTPRDELLPLKEKDKDAVFVVLPFYSRYLVRLRSVYPEGRTERVYGGPQNKLLFTVFYVPKERLES